MDTNITAVTRNNETGKSVARKLRAAGRLPGVVYSNGGTATPVHVDPDAIERIFRTTRNPNTVLQVDIDGTVTPCLVRELQRHPLTREMVHIDLYSLTPGQQVEVQVPVRTVGKAKGAMYGGRIRLLRQKVGVRCDWAHIPEFVDVDITPLKIGDGLRASHLENPENAEVRFQNDFMVLTCYGKKGAQMQAEAAAAAEANG